MRTEQGKTEQGCSAKGCASGDVQGRQKTSRALPRPTPLALAVPCPQVYETGLKVIPGEEPPSKEEWARHPTEPAALCEWYRQHSGKFGLWTDIIAVRQNAARVVERLLGARPMPARITILHEVAGTRHAALLLQQQVVTPRIVAFPLLQVAPQASR